MAENAAPRILIIRRRYLGDIVLLGSLVRNLRLHWPGAHLAVLVERRFADLLTLNPDVNEALALPQRLTQWPGFLRRLHRAGYTHVVDLDNTEKTAFVGRMSGAPMRVALHHGQHPLKFRAAYTHVVYDPEERHEARSITDYNLLALEPLGAPLVTQEIRLAPRESDVADLRRFVGASRRVLLVHPGSRSVMRLWPAENFAAVIDYAQDELDAQVILVGGPTDEPILSAIRSHVKTHLLNLPASFSIERFAALARISHLLLCHDSGPMHVAAAVGTPVVAIYGAQNAALFCPMGDGHVIIQPPLPCLTCVAPEKCIREDSYQNYCVRNVTVGRVKEAVRKKLVS